MSDRNDQWSWEGVNTPYGESSQQNQQGPYGAAPPPYGGGQSPYGQQPVTPAHQPSYGDQLAWTGAPPGQKFAAGDLKPGIIALRPLSFGEFFDGAFRAIQHNPQVMFGLSLAVAVILSLIQALLMGGALLQLSDMTNPYPIGVGADALVALSGGTLIAGALAVVATIVLNGVLVVSVSQSVLGRRVSIGEVWNQCKGVILRLIGVTFLVSLLTFAGVIIATVTVGLLAFAAGSSLDEGSFVIVILLLLAGIALVVAISAFFYVRFGLAATAIVMERARVIESMRRSWRLTKGFFWRNGFVLLLGTVIVGAITGVFSIPLSLLVAWTAGLGDSGVWVGSILTVAVSALLSALTTPFIAALSALLYVDLRMRKEGLDVELIRAASS